MRQRPPESYGPLRVFGLQHFLNILSVHLTCSDTSMTSDIGMFSSKRSLRHRLYSKYSKCTLSSVWLWVFLMVGHTKQAFWSQINIYKVDTIIKIRFFENWA